MTRFLVAMAAMLSMLLSGACANAEPPPEERPREPVVGLPCEGCEAVFQGMPASIPSRSRIAPDDEPGRPMRITGTVRDADGKPAPDVIVYAYHTNTRGLYPTDERFGGQAAFRHGLLRGWAKTDAEGQYAFETIRPAGYPGTDIPEHVHVHVIEVGRCTYYIDDILFDDDPRLTAPQRARLLTGRGGNGLVVPRKDAEGRLVVTRDIVLGQGVPGHPGAS